MALLFMDGFDYYGTSDLSTMGKWTTGATVSMTTATSPVRTGTTAAAAPTTSFGNVTRPLTATGGFVVGFAFRLGALPVTTDFLRIREGAATDHLMVTMVATTNVLQVKNGSGTVLATGTTVLTINNWYYLEFKGTIHDTTGSFELRLDGVAEPNCLMTNVDTRNGGTGQWDRVWFSGATTGSTYTWFDDFYVCDMSGSIRNDFLGPIKIEVLMPQIGNGSNVGLTPSTGTDHGALVDEIPANTTDYNSSLTVGAKDTYNLPTPTLTGAILGVQVNIFAAKSDAGLRKVCGVLRAGGTDYDGADKSLLTAYATYSELRMQNPATSADWTVADVTALEAGMKVTA